MTNLSSPIPSSSCVFGRPFPETKRASKTRKEAITIQRRSSKFSLAAVGRQFRGTRRTDRRTDGMDVPERNLHGVHIRTSAGVFVEEVLFAYAELPTAEGRGRSEGLRAQFVRNRATDVVICV